MRLLPLLLGSILKQSEFSVTIELMLCSGPEVIHIRPTVITSDNTSEIIARYEREMIRVWRYIPNTLPTLS